MSAKCNNCIYMNEKDINKWGEGYCCHLKKYTTLTGGCYSGQPREVSNCYLTTAMCEVLGYEDDCDILENLRGFRDWYMYNDPLYQNALDEYDKVGPVIASKIVVDEERKNVAMDMLDFFIIPAIGCIYEERYEEAIDTYMLMTEMLKSRYNLGHRDKIKQKRL